MSSADGGAGEEHECPTCGRSDFKNKRGLEVHQNQYCDDDGGSAECPGCGRDDFASERSMKIHYNRFCDDAESDSIAGLLRECDYCGEEYRAGASRENPRFCEGSCYGDWRSENIVGKNNHQYNGGSAVVKCSWCDAELERGQYRAEKGELFWCHDTDCESEYKRATTPTGEDNPHYSRISVDCAVCGKSMKRQRHVVEKYDTFTCSPSCLKRSRTGEDSPNWQGGDPVYGVGWNPAKKELVRRRDGRTCRLCGKTQSEHMDEYGMKHTVHHIVKARSLQDAPAAIRNGTFNLLTICCSHNGSTIEKIHPWIQFMAFLPHPPLPSEKSELSGDGA